MGRPSVDDLGRIPLFGGVPFAALQAFADKATVVTVEAGREVFHEGDSARTLYVLEEGGLEVVKATDGSELTLSVIQPGESFGEMSFIDMQPRSATVRATAPSTMWMWTYSCIHERYCSDTKCAMLIVMNIARELSRRLRRADDQLCGH